MMIMTTLRRAGWLVLVVCIFCYTSTNSEAAPIIIPSAAAAAASESSNEGAPAVGETPSMTASSNVINAALDSIHESLRNGTELGSPRPAKIILFPPIIFESHVFIFKTLAKGLQKYGHHTTLYVSDRRDIEEDSPDFGVRRFPGIFSSDEAGAFLQKKVTNVLSGKPTFLELFDILGHYSQNCDVIFSEGRESIEQLRKDNYDLMIVDPNEMCGFLIAKELDIPYVVFSTGMWVPYEAYSPAPISYVPEFNSQLDDKMNFIQRLYNTLIYGVSRFGTSYLIFPIYNKLITKHHIGGENPIHIAELIGLSQAWLLSTDLALEFPRPVMPQVEYVGGLLGRPAKALPEDFKVLADSGPFIIVSFGAGVKRLNAQLEAIFAKILSDLPYNVIWRYPSTVEGLGPNVKAVDWLPQKDLLGHPNVKLFIGHGGTNGVYECIFHSVPVIGMPLFGDHYDSMTRVQSKGAGISLNWKTLTEEKLQAAVQDVLLNPKYAAAIRRLSVIHHDQPMHPLDRAAYRIDYTLRYRGAAHLRPAVFDMHPLQFFLVDVQLALVAAIAAIGYVLHHLVVYITVSKKDQQQLRPVWMLWPKIIVSRIVGAIIFGLLQVCYGVRLAAVHCAHHCGKCTKTSRGFLRCLDGVSRSLEKKLPFRYAPVHNSNSGCDTNGDIELDNNNNSRKCSLEDDHPAAAAAARRRDNMKQQLIDISTTTASSSSTSSVPSDVPTLLIQQHHPQQQQHFYGNNNNNSNNSNNNPDDSSTTNSNSSSILAPSPSYSAFSPSNVSECSIDSCSTATPLPNGRLPRLTEETKFK